MHAIPCRLVAIYISSCHNEILSHREESNFAKRPTTQVLLVSYHVQSQKAIHDTGMQQQSSCGILSMGTVLETSRCHSCQYPCKDELDSERQEILNYVWQCTMKLVLVSINALCCQASSNDPVDRSELLKRVFTCTGWWNSSWASNRLRGCSYPATRWARRLSTFLQLMHIVGRSCRNMELCKRCTLLQSRTLHVITYRSSAACPNWQVLESSSSGARLSR